MFGNLKLPLLGRSLNSFSLPTSKCFFFRPELQLLIPFELQSFMVPHRNFLNFCYELRFFFHLSIISRGFAFSFTKKPRTTEIVFLSYRVTILLLRPLSLELSNNLSLIEAWLLLWSPRTKYTLCSTLQSPLATVSRLTTFLFDIWGSYWYG